MLRGLTYSLLLALLVACRSSSRLFHLHPELVDGAGSGDASVLLCRSCHDVCDRGGCSDYSIAGGNDYGLLSRMTELEPLSVLEQTLIARHRLYHVVVKARRRLVAHARPPLAPRRPAVRHAPCTTGGDALRQRVEAHVVDAQG